VFVVVVFYGLLGMVRSICFFLSIRMEDFNVLHPLTVLPIIAQFGMLWYLVMPEKFSSKINLKICIWTLLLLFVFVSFIAFLSLNHKMILGSLPFVICAIWVLLILRRFDRASIKH
jgi:hypothetical protein